MKIKILGADSLGVRSMAILIELGKESILIDPACALAPNRFSLPPHPEEIRQLNLTWKRIKKASFKSNYVIFTHYHYDHHNPRNIEILKNKRVFLKDPESTNYSQFLRGKHFISLIKPLVFSLEIADTLSFSLNGVKIRFSEPLNHGPSDKLGKVLMLTIEERKKFIYSSDVEGIWERNAFNYVLNENPELLYLDGPPTYLTGNKFPREIIKLVEKNIVLLFRECDNLKTIIFDHHPIRDLAWKNYFKEAISYVKKMGKNILSAAEFANTESLPLESKRRKLYEKNLSKGKGTPIEGYSL